MENDFDTLDKEKLYLSPSKESVMAFVNGKWYQFMREDIVRKLLKPEQGEYYTLDMIDPKKPFKAIAGEDALFLNPVYNLNKK
jgi:hypothetical protein